MEEKLASSEIQYPSSIDCEPQDENRSDSDGSSPAALIRFVHAPPIINGQPSSKLGRALVWFLIPSTLIGVTVWPLTFCLSILPPFGVFALPFLLFLSVFLLYSLAWIPFLILAQDDRPEPGLGLPFSPLRAQRVIAKLAVELLSFWRSNWIELLLDYSYRKIIVLRFKSNVQQPMLQPDQIYNEDTQNTEEQEPGLGVRRKKSCDVYVPISVYEPDRSLSPVLVFIHPGDWRWTNKNHYLQLGLNLRRYGFCVVIPDFTKFPEGRCDEAVTDIQDLLNWIYCSIDQYGGDPNRILLAGHGSGAHLSILTVLQSAISASISNEPESNLPPIEAVILLAGIYDPIRLLRDQVKDEWHQLSSLRRSLGPSHSITLAHSPTHLIHRSLDFLQPKYLPPKFLLIHGGEDEQVPIYQSLILKTLLSKIGNTDDGLPWEEEQPKIILKAFKHLNHFDSLLSLMIDSNSLNYRQAIIQEILDLVN